jgi:pyruvyl transferase EpsO
MRRKESAADWTHLPAEDARTFREFRDTIDQRLDEYIPAGEPAALLQFPYDGNVGNHMMWAATADYLERRGVPLAYVAHGNNFDVEMLRRTVGRGTVLFLGGVTVSRLWPRHAEVKRLVAEALPDNRLISLPATMLFVDSADGEGAGELFGAHRRVTLMARDPRSEREARGVFPAHIDVLTVPDMALRLGPQPRRSPAEFDVIWLARDDLEGVGTRPPENVFVFDWPKLLEIRRAYYALRASGVFSRARARVPVLPYRRLVAPAMAQLYRLASHEVLSFGNRVLDRGKVLVTDRMHPHIHAALRGQHVVLLPDKFGKNRAVFDGFTHRLTRVHWADTPAEALALAQELAKKP